MSALKFRIGAVVEEEEDEEEPESKATPLLVIGQRGARAHADPRKAAALGKDEAPTVFAVAQLGCRVPPNHPREQEKAAMAILRDGSWGARLKTLKHAETTEKMTQRITSTRRRPRGGVQRRGVQERRRRSGAARAHEQGGGASDP